MPARGKLLMLPLRVTPQMFDLPDVQITLPEIEVPAMTAPPPTGEQFIVHDIIGMLPTEPNWSIGVAPKESLTVHWEGGAAIPQMSVNEHTLFLQGIARFHIRKNWAASGVVNGDGIMYHEAIGQNGDVYLMRPDGAILYHSNMERGNKTSRAILIVCSEQTPPTELQLASLRKRVTDIRGHWNRNAPVYPHSVWTPTACPGDQIRATVAGL